MCGEEPVHKSDLPGGKQTKDQADDSRCGHQTSVDPREPVARKREGYCESQRHQHHSHNRSQSKNQKVKNSPAWASNCSEYQKSHRRRTGQSMHDSDQQRPQRMKKPQTRKGSAQPVRWLDFVPVMLRAGAVCVRMVVRVVTMSVQM